MGCSCNKNKQSSNLSSKTNTQQSSSVKKASDSQPKVVISGNSPAPKVVEQGVCDKLYDELTILDSKTYDLFRRTRFDDTGDGYQWLQVQKQIREWKTKLKIECPDDAQLNMVRELVNTEYAKLF